MRDVIDRGRFQPRAAPIEMLRGKPAEPMRRQAPPPENSLIELGQALKSISPGLEKFLNSYYAQKQAEDAKAGEADALKHGSTDYAQAVSKGLIPADASPFYVKAYKERVGRTYAREAYLQAWQDYEASPLRGSTDMLAVRDFLTSKVEETLGNLSDKDVIAGAVPEIELMLNNITQHHIGRVSSNIVADNEERLGVAVGQAIDIEIMEARRDGRPLDTNRILTAIHGEEAAAREVGVAGTALNEIVARTIAEKAEQYNDLDLLELATAKRPDGTPGAGATTKGMAVLNQSARSILSLQFQLEDRAYRDLERRQRQALDHGIRMFMQLAEQNAEQYRNGGPEMPFPQELADQLSRLDPEFRLKAQAIWTKVTEFETREDPRLLAALEADILEMEDPAAARRYILNQVGSTVFSYSTIQRLNNLTDRRERAQGALDDPRIREYKQNMVQFLSGMTGVFEGTSPMARDAELRFIEGMTDLVADNPNMPLSELRLRARDLATTLRDEYRDYISRGVEANELLDRRELRQEIETHIPYQNLLREMIEVEEGVTDNALARLMRARGVDLDDPYDVGVFLDDVKRAYGEDVPYRRPPEPVESPAWFRRLF
ncbi:hypothetical protein [Telmatospirillum sp. J64-1]|uniref:hypothetical protein n=1 Tax=Telmatospirillum sp. J64-1 TaxID=2502183 RepID=UPI00115C88FB|nr:hypothetical protein [Telmatospirillum sp. J64-1]